MNYNLPDPFDFTSLKVFKTFETTKSALSEITQKDIIIDPFHILLNYDFGKINGSKVVEFFCGEEPTHKCYNTQTNITIDNKGY